MGRVTEGSFARSVAQRAVPDLAFGEFGLPLLRTASQGAEFRIGGFQEPGSAVTFDGLSEDVLHRFVFLLSQMFQGLVRSWIHSDISGWHTDQYTILYTQTPQMGHR